MGAENPGQPADNSAFPKEELPSYSDRQEITRTIR